MSATFGLVLVLVAGASRLVEFRSAKKSHLPHLDSYLMALLVAVFALGALTELPAEPRGFERAVQIVSDGSEPRDSIVFPTADARLPFDAAWKAHHHTSAPLPIASAVPLGSAKRILNPPKLQQLVTELPRGRVWVIVRRYQHVENPDLLGAAQTRRRFRQIQSWTTDAGVEITLLAPRS